MEQQLQTFIMSSWVRCVHQAIVYLGIRFFGPPTCLLVGGGIWSSSSSNVLRVFAVVQLQCDKAESIILDESRSDRTFNGTFGGAHLKVTPPEGSDICNMQSCVRETKTRVVRWIRGGP